VQKKTKLWIVVVAILVASAFLHVYYITDSSAATVYSSGDEAYLFFGDFHTGYRVRYLAFPFAVLSQYFSAPILPTDRLGCSLVLRVTPSGVERHLTHCGDPNLQFVAFLTPFEDGFYALCRGSILCKWTENGFVPATSDEERRLDGTTRLIRGDINNQTVNGWQVHRVGWAGDHFEVPVGKDLVIAAKNRSTDVRNWQYPWITVDLLRPGQSPQNVYDVNGMPRRVGRKEYERVFH
jgi:hypothetical protein